MTDRAIVHSILTHDRAGTADDDTVDAVADAILARDNSVPTGTYIDICLHLPVVDPALITCPIIVMRGQHDGIAGVDDLLQFFRRLPAPDKQVAVMPGIAHAGFQQKNHRLVQHILASLFAQPEPAMCHPPRIADCRPAVTNRATGKENLRSGTGSITRRGLGLAAAGLGLAGLSRGAAARAGFPRAISAW